MPYPMGHVESVERNHDDHDDLLRRAVGW